MMDNRSESQGSPLDQAAIALSGLCLAHCLLFPVSIALLPVLNRFSADHFHVQMLFVVVPVSAIAFILGFRRHRNPAIVTWGIAGIATLVFGGTVAHANYGALADTLLTIAGSIILGTAHFLNNRRTRHVRMAVATGD